MGVEEATRVVLVVEDDALVRETIAGEFRHYGWNVLEAPSGELALFLAADAQIDIVFTDIQLAGQMSGWDIAEALRDKLPALPVLYTSGNPANLTRQVDGSLFVGKPYDAGFVIEACHNLLDTPEEPA